MIVYSFPGATFQRYIAKLFEISSVILRMCPMIIRVYSWVTVDAESTLAHFFQAGNTPVTPFSGGHKRVFGDIEPREMRPTCETSLPPYLFLRPFTTYSLFLHLGPFVADRRLQSFSLCFLNLRRCGSSDWPYLDLINSRSSPSISITRADQEYVESEKPL